MDNKHFAFDRQNYILLGISAAIIVVGFLLMSGAGSDETTFNADIFSARRVKVAPVVCLIGFLSMIYAVMRRPKDGADTKEDETE